MRMLAKALALVLVAASPLASEALTLSSGDFYGTHFFSNTIRHYSSSGAVLETLDVPAALGSDIRGLAFGPDQLLYAVAQRGSGYAVLAMHRNGTVHQTYPVDSSYIGGNISLGKIAFDDSGHFYVGSLRGVTKFTVGQPGSGTLINSSGTNGALDIEALPGGALLVLGDYELFVMGPDGTVLRQIGSFPGFPPNNRGVEFDPASNTIFVTTIGFSAFAFQLARFDGTTGDMRDSTFFWYGDDMVLAHDGRLIVGSRTQAPGIFSPELVQTGSFAGPENMFITQFVPEPAPWLALGAGALLVLLRLGAPHCRGARAGSGR